MHFRRGRPVDSDPATGYGSARTLCRRFGPTPRPRRGVVVSEGPGANLRLVGYMASIGMRLAMEHTASQN
jgi:hypothetical protein